MKRKLFLQTIGGIAALIPALRAKAAKPEVAITPNVPDITQQDSPGWSKIAAKFDTSEKRLDLDKFGRYVVLEAVQVTLVPQYIDSCEGKYFLNINELTISGINDYQKLSGNLGTRNVNYEVNIPDGTLRFTGILTEYYGYSDCTAYFETGPIKFIPSKN